MQRNLFEKLRNSTLFPALVATGLLAGCSGGTDGAANSAADVPAQAGDDGAQSSTEPARATAKSAADFEGSMQQLSVMVGADAIGKLAGSNDLAAVLALSPDRVIDAVDKGEIEAIMVERSTVEIDDDMARIQAEGTPQYTVIDGDALAAHVVDPDSRMIITMDPARMAEARRGGAGEPVRIDAEQIGEREIRGFDTTGYRFEFMADNLATVWLSEDLEDAVGPIFDIMAAVSPFGPMDVGEGAPVRSVMVNRKALAGGSSYLPAYTITEFYGLEPGPVADDRFDLPEGYQRQGMADLGRGPQ